MVIFATLLLRITAFFWVSSVKHGRVITPLFIGP